MLWREFLPGESLSVFSLLLMQVKREQPVKSSTGTASHAVKSSSASLRKFCCWTEQLRKVIVSTRHFASICEGRHKIRHSWFLKENATNRHAFLFYVASSSSDFSRTYQNPLWIGQMKMLAAHLPAALDYYWLQMQKKYFTYELYINYVWYWFGI